MHRLGLEFQEQVAIKVLGRILKLAMPQRGTHPSIQKKAAASIKEWAATVGPNSHLSSSSFANAAGELASKEATQQRRASQPLTLAPGPASVSDLHAMACRAGLGDLTTEQLLELARISQSAIAEQISATHDGERSRQLRFLHRHLTADIDHFSCSAASAL